MFNVPVSGNSSGSSSDDEDFFYQVDDPIAADHTGSQYFMVFRYLNSQLYFLKCVFMT